MHRGHSIGKAVQESELSRLFILFLQIYEVALYVEEKGAKAEFWRLSKAGFFKTLDEETLCSALLEGKFSKLLQIRLLRSVTSSQLTGEIGRDLEPRLARTGNEALWLRFKDYVDNKSLEKGSNFMALVHGTAHFRKDSTLFSL